MTTPMKPDQLLDIARQRMERGEYRLADNFVLMVLEKHADRADAWALAAHIAFRAGKLDECRTRIGASLARAADEPLALALRGTLKQGAHDWVGAAADYEVALQKMPADARLMNALATCWRMMGRPAESLAMYERSVALAPDYLEAWNNMGVLAHEHGDLALAERTYRHILDMDASVAHTHNNLATLLQARGDVVHAERHYRRAVELDPNYAVAWKNLAALYQVQHLWDASLDAYDRAAALQANFAEAQAGGLYMAMQMAQWDGLSQRCQALLHTLSVDVTAKIPPFSFLSLDDNPTRQLDVSRRWARGYTAASRSFAARPAGKRIRLGYVGGDFFSHATTWLTAGLFRGHDRSRFEVFGYDYGLDDQSPARHAVIGDFDRYIHLPNHSPAEIAACIQADEVDILIDLKGWTRDTKAELMAWRPAPLQVHYLAFPGTLGAPYCDYLIADPVTAPAGCEPFYDEALIRLPHSYQINDNKRQVSATPSRVELGLPESALILVCFNQHYKLNPLVFEVWMRVLARVPDASLWLMKGQAHAQENLCAEAAKHGIDPARILFAPARLQADHIARFAAADLALDTYPFNSHTTASDALWAGVPLVALSGKSFCSRVSASCLHALDMSELVATSLEDYENLIVGLCQDRGRLAALRAKLAANRDTQPLFDTTRSVRDLERAYEAIWERYMKGLAPAHINLAA